MHIRIPSFVSNHKKLSIGLAALVLLSPLAILLVGFAMVQPYNKYVLNPHNKQAIFDKNIRVGLVMGAGITKNGEPYKELQARLDVAAAGLKAGYVDKLVLTGDNRFKNYDEPAAMRNYLVNVKRISASKLQVDDAGRDTYQSCERAVKIFGIHKTIIFSAGTHLPRAIFSCRSFGIEAYGIASGVEANNASRREFLARTKAVWNVYFVGEHTILGPPIKV